MRLFLGHSPLKMQAIFRRQIDDRLTTD